MKDKINKNLSIGKLIEQYPDSVDILVKYGFHCIGCSLAQYETIEQGATAHGLNKKQLRNLIEDLNKISKKEKKN